MALISCKGLSFAYGGETVLRGVSFGVNAGDYLCVVGENGSGKSTLMKGLLGLKEPESGSIEYGDGLRRSEIGYLPQQTALQKDFPASVFEVVLSGRLNSLGRRFFYSKEDKKEAERNLERMGMLELKNAATRSSQAASSRGYCWLGRCAPRRSCCCSTSRSRVSTPWRRGRCTTS